MRRSRERDATEFTDWVAARHPTLRRTAYLLCAGDGHSADDLTQATLAKMYLAWGRLRDHHSIDAYARRIIGWRVGRRMTTDLVLDALEHAVFTRRREGIADLTGLVAHSDAGSQYVSIAMTQRLLDEGIDPSVGSVGDAYDNALAETTVGSFKTEMFRRLGPWRDVDHIEVETAQCIHWFNTERPHEYLNDLTPEQAEQLHYDLRALAAAG